MLNPEIQKFFSQADLCWLATTLEDGSPNLIPVGFKWVWEGKLVLADLFFGKTRESLLRSPRVAIGVATHAPKVGFQMKGWATVHQNGPIYDLVSQNLAALGVGAPPWAAVLVDVEAVYVLDPGPFAGHRIL